MDTNQIGMTNEPTAAEPTTTAEPLNIEIWSDIACPWCWVGKKHIETALATFDEEVRIIWRAFELNPQAPTSTPQSVDYAERLASKYGMSRRDAEGFIGRMTAAGAEQGIDIRFDRIRPCNTFRAHRLLSWSSAYDLQDALKERLFRAYMTEGLDLNDVSTLSQLAADVGLDADGAAGVLTSDAHSQEVRAEQARAAALGIRGVPFFVFGPGITASGAQPPDMLHNALVQARSIHAAAKASVSETEASPGTCSVDGCVE